MALYWLTLQFYVCVYVSFVCQYVAPPVSVITTLYYVLCCDDYFPSSSVLSCAFCVLCVYSKFGHHPHHLGYLCAKLRYFHGLHC